MLTKEKKKKNSVCNIYFLLDKNSLPHLSLLSATGLGESGKIPVPNTIFHLGSFILK